MKATMIVGLPGSGKTYLGNQFSVPFVDDISIVGLGALDPTSDVVIADVFLCRELTRKHAIDHMVNLGYELEWIFFENNPEKCLRNVDYRNDGRSVKETIIYLSKEYTIPEGITPREIWQDHAT